MKLCRLQCLLALLPFLCVQAQVLNSLSTATFDSDFSQFFGEFKAFSSEASVRVYDRNEQELIRTDMQFAVRDGKLRMELDLAQLKSSELPSGVAASLKPLGMDKVISLVLPEQNSAFIVYPGMKAYLKLPTSENGQSAASAGLKSSRQAIGTETLDGHPCVKHRVTLTDAAGDAQEAITWNASDLNGFPIQIQTSDEEHLIIMRFRNPVVRPPDQKMFALPVGYTEYRSQQALLQAVMMKAFSGLGEE